LTVAATTKSGCSFFRTAGIFEIMSCAQCQQADRLSAIAAMVRCTISQAHAVGMDTLNVWQAIDAINFLDDARQGSVKWKYMTNTDRIRYLVWVIEFVQASGVASV